MNDQNYGKKRHSLLWLWITLGVVGTLSVVLGVLLATGVFTGSKSNEANVDLPIDAEHKSRYTNHSEAPYQAPTEECITSFESLVSDLYEKTASLIDNNGYVSDENKDDLLRIAGDYVRDQYQKGVLSEYSIDEDSVFLRDAVTGITYTLIAPIEGVDAAGVDAEISICTFQPFREDYIKNRDEETGRMMSYPDDAAIRVDANFDNYTFLYTKNLDNEAVPFDIFKQFGPNQVIIWHGHGDYTSALGPFICTSTKSSVRFKLDHWDDYINNRITNCGFFGFSIAHLTVCVTSEYIKTYSPDLTGSVIYMGICESGRNDQLANAFLDKGAVAYIGNSKSINTKYNLRMQNTIFNILTQINASTGDYYTIEEARQFAYQMHGTSDGSKRYATPKIFGDRHYRLRSTVDERALCPDADQRTTVADNHRYYGPWQETYLTILQNHAEKIRAYQSQQSQYMSYLDGDPLYVALPDMNGDLIPELIFIRQPDHREGSYDEDLELEADLYVYSSNGKETRCVVTIRDVYVEASNGADYTISFCPRDQTFHVEYYVGNGAWQRTFSIPNYLEQVYMRVLYGDPEEYDSVSRHFLNGKYISGQHFNEEWATLSESPYKVIGSLDYKSDLPDKMFTVEEAIQYLQR